MGQAYLYKINTFVGDSGSNLRYLLFSAYSVRTHSNIATPPADTRQPHQCCLEVTVGYVFTKTGRWAS
jgi:hypothetical protein